MAETECGCFRPGTDNGAECGLQADERDPLQMRRLWSGDYDNEEVCRCPCHVDFEDDESEVHF